MLEGRSVDEERMRRNLDLAGGLIVAEAVMMGLTPLLGRQSAHDIVYSACRMVAESRRPFAEALSETASVAAHMTPEQIRLLTDPVRHLGSCGGMIDRVLEGRGDS